MALPAMQAEAAGQSYTINTVKVQFPCKAYPSQLSMMDKILKGLERGQNCLLESPTGSGKSLALLCAALAWQKTEFEKLKREEDAMKDADKCCCNCSTSAATTVIETAAPDIKTSATVNQINEHHVDEATVTLAMDCETDDGSDDDFKPDKKHLRLDSNIQLNSKEPSPALSVQPQNQTVAGECCVCNCQASNKKKRIPKIYFGTRTHKQLAQIIRELNKTAYNNSRMTVLSSREHSCIHPEIAPVQNKNEACKELLDGVGCPYFDRARRVFTHSFLEDHGFQPTWDLEDIIPFSKKQRACCYFGTRQLRETANIVFCPYNYLVDPHIRKSLDITLKDQIVILDEAHNIEDSSRDAASFSITQAQLLDTMEDLDYIAGMGVKPSEHRYLRELCADIGDLIEKNKAISGTQSDSYETASKIWTGIEIVAQLQLMGITSERLDMLRTCYDVISARDEEPEVPALRRRMDRKKSDEVRIKAATGSVLGGLFVVLQFIFKDNMKFVDDYRVVLTKSMGYTNAPTSNRWLNKKRRPREMAWTYQLNFWCMNPAVAFTDMSDGVRSVVLTSGTLSPMTSFQSELGIPFPIQLEANHVISNSQVWVGCLSRGPSNHQLLGSYQNAETWAYQDEIGNILLQVCQTVPYGVLCFLPSYKSLEKLSSRWQNADGYRIMRIYSKNGFWDTGLLDQVRTFKTVITEPRSSDSENFDDVMRRYYELIQECSSSDSMGTKLPSGAVFLAVCRGKVSEGMDFADNNARAVLVVSIPYPNLKDTQIELKKQYNDQRSASKGLLCGRDWYDIQAFRAMNQALGRCIRHRRDWGSLILIDERFSKNPQKYTTGLSKWVRQRVQYFNMFNIAKSSLHQFTQSHCIADDSAVADVSSFLSSPKVHSMDESTYTISLAPVTMSTSFQSPSVVPLMAIQNFTSSQRPRRMRRERKPRERRPRVRHSWPTDDSDGDMRLFMKPQLPVGTSQRSMSGFSQAGGFIPESQPIDISQEPAEVAYHEQQSDDEDDDDDVVILDVENGNATRDFESTEFSATQFHIKPLMASTQIDDRSASAWPLCFETARSVMQQRAGLLTSSPCLPVATTSRNSTHELRAELKEISTLAALQTASVEVIGDGVETPSAFSSEMKSEGLIQQAIQRSAVEMIAETSTFDVIANANDSCLNASQSRCDSPDLFDSEESNMATESVKQKEPDVDPGEQHDCVERLQRSPTFCSKVKKSDAARHSKPESVSCNVDAVHTNPYGGVRLASKLHHRKLAADASEEVSKAQIETASSAKQEITDKVVDTVADEKLSELKKDSNVCEKLQRYSRNKRQTGTAEESKTKSKVRPGRGVDFLDEIDERATVVKSAEKLVCPKCDSQLLLEQPKRQFKDVVVTHVIVPAFWTAFANNIGETLSNEQHSVLSIESKHLDTSQLTESEKADTSDNNLGVRMNSYWSEVDGCCVKPLYCCQCTKNGCITWLGVCVKAVTSHRQQIRIGQVWLKPACLRNF